MNNGNDARTELELKMELADIKLKRVLQKEKELEERLATSGEAGQLGKVLVTKKEAEEIQKNKNTGTVNMVEIKGVPWGMQAIQKPKEEVRIRSDGSTASYYELPYGAAQLQDLISHKNMNAQIGEIFRATYRYGQSAHSSKERDIKKIIFYANEELKRLKKINTPTDL